MVALFNFVYSLKVTLQDFLGQSKKSLYQFENGHAAITMENLTSASRRASRARELRGKSF